MINAKSGRLPAELEDGGLLEVEGGDGHVPLVGVVSLPHAVGDGEHRPLALLGGVGVCPPIVHHSLVDVMRHGSKPMGKIRRLFWQGTNGLGQK